MLLKEQAIGSWTLGNPKQKNKGPGAHKKQKKQKLHAAHFEGINVVAVKFV